MAKVIQYEQFSRHAAGKGGGYGRPFPVGPAVISTSTEMSMEEAKEYKSDCERAFKPSKWTLYKGRYYYTTEEVTEENKNDFYCCWLVIKYRNLFILRL